MPSAAAKKKLKAFQFIDGAPSLQSDDKENRIEQQVQLDGTTAKPALKPPARWEKADTNRDKEQAVKTVGRPPLSHLAGPQRPVQQISPSQENSHTEELLWRRSTPKCPDICATPARKNNDKSASNGNKRKRPMSSSPPSDLSRKFKTPKQDPAEDVWSRYCGDKSFHAPNSGEGLDQASQSKLENLLIDSSPRSSATVGSVGGLRRYASCGVQFPTSREKEKRQQGRLERFRAQAPPPAFEPTDASGSRMSKVGQLLEEAKRMEMQKRLRAMDAVQTNTEAEAIDTDNVFKPPPRPSFQESPLHSKSNNDASVDVAAEPKSDSTDFGEVDIDPDQLDDMFQAIENPGVKQDPAPPQPPILIPLDDSDDEYGDMDLSLGELEHMDASLAAMTQQSGTISNAHLNQAQQCTNVQTVAESGGAEVGYAQTNTRRVPESDEYGDDFDLEDIIALETQSNDPSDNVCIFDLRGLI
jgi:hypothetical protein